jgi:hypothetical protein
MQRIFAVLRSLTCVGRCETSRRPGRLGDEVGQPTSEDRDKRLRNIATMHMPKGLAQNLVYYSRLLKAHPQTLIKGKATCCGKHANLDAPV